MTATARKQTAQREVTINKTFDAPRGHLFKMWTDPKQLAQWWGPKGFTNPTCKIDAKPGGAIYIAMRAPDGTDYPMSGTVREVAEPERLVFTSVAEDKDGTPHLEGHNIVTFAEQGGKTRLTVQSSAVGFSAAAPHMLSGMEAGWTQSLEKLAELVARS